MGSYWAGFWRAASLTYFIIKSKCYFILLLKISRKTLPRLLLCSRLYIMLCYYNGTITLLLKLESHFEFARVLNNSSSLENKDGRWPFCFSDKHCSVGFSFFCIKNISLKYCNIILRLQSWGRCVNTWAHAHRKAVQEKQEPWNKSRGTNHSVIIYSAYCECSCIIHKEL